MRTISSAVRTITIVACVAAAFTCAAGCVALKTVKVNPNDTATEGVRYALPQPFIRVHSDGKLADDIVYLPDANRSYAVQTRSYLGAYTANFDLQDGFLTGVTWKADTSGLAPAAVTGATTIATGQVEAEQKRREAAADLAKQVVDAEKALADAEIALKYAQRKYDRLQADGSGASDADKAAAERELEEARVAYNAAYNALQRLRGGKVRNLSDPAPAPPAPTAPSAPSDVEQAPKLSLPSLYAVVEDDQGYVHLVPVNQPWNITGVTHGR